MIKRYGIHLPRLWVIFMGFLGLAVFAGLFAGCRSGTGKALRGSTQSVGPPSSSLPEVTVLTTPVSQLPDGTQILGASSSTTIDGTTLSISASLSRSMDGELGGSVTVSTTGSGAIPAGVGLRTVVVLRGSEAWVTGAHNFTSSSSSFNFDLQGGPNWSGSVNVAVSLHDGDGGVHYIRKAFSVSSQ